MVFYILIYFNLWDFDVRFSEFLFGFEILFGFTSVILLRILKIKTRLFKSSF